MGPSLIQAGIQSHSLLELGQCQEKVSFLLVEKTALEVGSGSLAVPLSPLLQALVDAQNPEGGDGQHAGDGERGESAIPGGARCHCRRMSRRRLCSYWVAAGWAVAILRG